MNHFDITRWADFARGLVPVTERAAMEAHVSSGCGRCREALTLMQRVVVVAQAERQYEPPDHLVRWAKAIGGLQRPQSTEVPHLLTRLLYNSLLDPVPAGMRAGDRGSHQVLYEAGDFCLDLRLDRETVSPLVMMVGQVTNRLDPDAFVEKAPVLLKTRREIVAHAVSNRFGEFQLKYAPERHLRLSVAVEPGGHRIELPLDDIGVQAARSSVASKPGVLRRLKAKPTRRRPR